MNLQALRDQIPESGKDIRLNLETILTPEGAPGLSLEQVSGIALACAYSTRQVPLSAALRSDLGISSEINEAAKAAATIMAMNNVYYRTMHLIEDKEISKLPARLRMNVIGKPGIAKADFELMCLAVSAIAGCGMCINSHISEVKKQGLTQEAIHSSIRIASVIQATAQALALT